MKVTIDFSDAEYNTAEDLAAQGIGNAGDGPNLTADELIAWQSKEYLRVKADGMLTKARAEMTAVDIAEYKKYKEEKDEEKENKTD